MRDFQLEAHYRRQLEAPPLSLMRRRATFCLSLWLIASPLVPGYSQVAGKVDGVVVDANGGEPLARVEIELQPSAERRITGNKGEFTFSDVPPGDYVLRVSTVGYRLVKEAFALAAGEVKTFDVSLVPDILRQTVEVKASPFEMVNQDSPSVLSLRGDEARNLASVLADDPLRAVQGLPGVQSNDDFKSQFSLRGADFHRIGMYLDNVLLHAPFDQVADEPTSGSLTVVSGDTLNSIDLYNGAYSVRYSDTTAGVLDLQTREGSRARRSFRASASASNASFLGEGPLGHEHRGAWLASARKSYLQYLVKRISSDPSLAFGFYDFQGRATYDLSPKNHLSLSAVDSHSALDRTSYRDKLGLNSVMTSGLHYTLADLAWTYASGPRFFVTSRLAAMREKFENQNPQNTELEAGSYTEAVLDSDGAWLWDGRNPFNFGLSIRRIGDHGFYNRYQYAPLAFLQLENFDGVGTRLGAYAEQSWSAAQGRVRASAGLRWDRHNVDDVAALSPQAAVALRILPSTRIDLGWGRYVQYPDMEWLSTHFAGFCVGIGAANCGPGFAGLRPERATNFTAAVEQRLDDRTRFRAEFYDREDRDLLFDTWQDPRLIAGQIFARPFGVPTEIDNDLRGYARGVEFILQRRSANRLSGWISYQLGYAHSRDARAGIAFPADYDQRHTANVYLSYRLRPSVNLSVKAVYGSGIPIPGFYQLQSTGYALAESRNAVRLKAYQRTDFRVNKTFVHDRWKINLYGEVINITNRQNERFDSFNGYNPSTAQAYLRFDTLIPILPSAGFVVEF